MEPPKRQRKILAQRHWLEAQLEPYRDFIMYLQAVFVLRRPYDFSVICLLLHLFLWYLLGNAGLVTIAASVLALYFVLAWFIDVLQIRIPWKLFVKDITPKKRGQLFDRPTMIANRASIQLANASALQAPPIPHAASTLDLPIRSGESFDRARLCMKGSSSSDAIADSQRVSPRPIQVSANDQPSRRMAWLRRYQDRIVQHIPVARMRTYQELIEELAVLRAQIDDVLSAIAELRKENINQFTLRAVVILLVVAYLGSSFGTFGVIYLTCFASMFIPAFIAFEVPRKVRKVARRLTSALYSFIRRREKTKLSNEKLAASKTPKPKELSGLGKPTECLLASTSEPVPPLARSLPITPIVPEDPLAMSILGDTAISLTSTVAITPDAALATSASVICAGGGSGAPASAPTSAATTPDHSTLGLVAEVDDNSSEDDGEDPETISAPMASDSESFDPEDSKEEIRPETKTGSVAVRPHISHKPASINLAVLKRRGTADDIFEPGDMSELAQTHPLARSLELSSNSAPQHVSSHRVTQPVAQSPAAGSPPRSISQQFVGLVKRSFSGGLLGRSPPGSPPNASSLSSFSITSAECAEEIASSSKENKAEKKKPKRNTIGISALDLSKMSETEEQQELEKKNSLRRLALGVADADGTRRRRRSGSIEPVTIAQPHSAPSSEPIPIKSAKKIKEKSYGERQVSPTTSSAQQPATLSPRRAASVAIDIASSGREPGYSKREKRRSSEQ